MRYQKPHTLKEEMDLYPWPHRLALLFLAVWFTVTLVVPIYNSL